MLLICLIQTVCIFFIEYNHFLQKKVTNGTINRKKYLIFLFFYIIENFRSSYYFKRFLVLSVITMIHPFPYCEYYFEMKSLGSLLRLRLHTILNSLIFLRTYFIIDQVVALSDYFSIESDSLW